MKSIAILGTSLVVSISRLLAVSGRHIINIDLNERPVSLKRRHIAASKRPKNGSKYMPHQGAKERERARRCYMSHWLNEEVAAFHPRDGHLRASPTLCQLSKRQYEAYFREVA